MAYYNILLKAIITSKSHITMGNVFKFQIVIMRKNLYFFTHQTEKCKIMNIAQNNKVSKHALLNN